MRTSLSSIAIGSLILSSVPASSQEPVSTYIVVQTVAGVIGTINGLAGAVNQAEWERKVSGKLDLIISQNGQILTELRELKVFIPAVLERSFDREVEIASKVTSKRFDQYMSAKTPDLEQIRNMRPEVETLAYNVAQRGPAVYPSAAALTLLGFSIFKVIEPIEDGQRDHFRNDMLTSMKRWLGDEPGMIGAVQKSEAQAVKDARAKLQAIRRGDVEIYSANSTSTPVSVSPSGIARGYRCELTMVAGVSIDDNQLTYAVSYKRAGGTCDGGGWTDGIVKDKVAEKQRSIQVIVDEIKSHQSRLDEITKHADALSRMVSAIEAMK